MDYDRFGAQLYALYYWNKVAHDGRIATNWIEDKHPKSAALYAAAPAGTIINDQAKRITLPKGTKEDDCTHFMSCCVGARMPLAASGGPPIMLGGGLRITQAYGGNPFGVDSVPSLLGDLTVRGYAREIAPPFRPKESPADVAATAAAIQTALAPGDLLAYANEKKAYQHFAMIVGAKSVSNPVPGGGNASIVVATIACHTDSRWGDSFAGVMWPHVTLVKML